MKKILESKVVKALLLLLINVSITATFVFVGMEQINKNLEQAKNIKLVTGVIQIKSKTEEYDEHAKDLGTQELSQSSSTSSSEQNSTTSSNSVNGTQVTLPPTTSTTINSSSKPSPNYASLIGSNILIKEGEAFNPLADLKIKAIDQDGTDITKKVQIVNNFVNVNQAGYYSVSVKVKLKDNTELTQTFSVEVVAQPLKVNLSNIALSKSIIEQGGSFKLSFNLDSSKVSVKPIHATVNGVTYPINKSSNYEFFIDLTASSDPKIESIVLNSIQMSDGTIISVNQEKKLTILKNMPKVEKVSERLDSKNGEMMLDIFVSDNQHAIKPNSSVTATLYNEFNEEVAKYDLIQNTQSTLTFNLPQNGKYRLEVIAELNLDHTLIYQPVKIYEEIFNIDTIDRSSLNGTNVSIKEGTTFEPIRDLGLVATNELGQDVTSSILVEHQVDPTIPGTYDVKASIIKLNGQRIEKLFTVIVEPIIATISIEKFNPLTSTVVAGQDMVINLEASLSKDYVEVEQVTINGVDYSVEKLDSNLNSYKKTYHITIPTVSVGGSYDVHLTKLKLSNDEELFVNELVSINLIKLALYNQEVNIVSDNEDLNNNTVKQFGTKISSFNNQTISGIDTQKHHSNLEITGQVYTTNGEVPTGQISVTLPTAVSFVVYENGQVLVASNMKIINNSSDVDVSVEVASFTDTTPSEGKGITVINASHLSDKDRSFISLSLSTSGAENTNTVSLLSQNFKGANLVTINAKSQVGLHLTGQAGEKTYVSASQKNEQDIDTLGTSDQFTLVFKIKKTN